MIKNYIVGQPKFVLFVDNVKLDPQSKKFFSQWLDNSTFLLDILQPARETTGPVKITSELIALPYEGLTDSMKNDTNITISVAELAQIYKTSDILKCVHHLKHQSKVKQIFAWASKRKISKTMLVPYLEHQANALVTIKNNVNLSIIIKKPGGLVTRKLFQYKVENDTLEVKEIAHELKEKVVEPKIDPESLATFKINVDEEEMVARNALKLPYERTSDIIPTTKESKIIYNPDSDDDFDEEDPDDDLNI